MIRSVKLAFTEIAYYYFFFNIKSNNLMNNPSCTREIKSASISISYLIQL